jgi:hypothetical protein
LVIAEISTLLARSLASRAASIRDQGAFVGDLAFPAREECHHIANARAFHSHASRPGFYDARANGLARAHVGKSSVIWYAFLKHHLAQYYSAIDSGFHSVPFSQVFAM